MSRSAVHYDATYACTFGYPVLSKELDENATENEAPKRRKKKRGECRSTKERKTGFPKTKALAENNHTINHRAEKGTSKKEWREGADKQRC